MRKGIFLYRNFSKAIASSFVELGKGERLREIKEWKEKTGFDENVVGCFLHNFEVAGICPIATGGWCKQYPKCSSMEQTRLREEKLRRARRTKIEYHKDWFAFPLCIDVGQRRELIDTPKYIGIHFLWWHWRYTFLKAGGKR